MHHHRACPVDGCSYAPDRWNDGAGASLTGSGLDVERLARAIRGAALGAVPADDGPMPDWYRAYAADVAREYAALSGDTTSETDGFVDREPPDWVAAATRGYQAGRKDGCACICGHEFERHECASCIGPCAALSGESGEPKETERP